MKRVFNFFLVFFLIGVFSTNTLAEDQSKSVQKKQSKINQDSRSPSSTAPDSGLSKAELKKLKSVLKKRRPSLLSSKSSKRFLRIHKWMGKKDKDSMNKAISLLKKIIQSPKNNPAEKFQAFWYLGMAYVEMEDYKNAVFHFEKSLSSPSIDFDRYLKLLITLSQIYLASDNVKKASELLGQWFSLTDKPKAQPHVLMAFIYYTEENKKKALEEILKAIHMTKKPDKKWLAFASNLYLQSENYQEAESFLNLLLTLYPSSQLHWKQLSSVQFKNDKRKETLASFRLAEKVQPLSKETAVIQLISLLVDRGIPYKAGQILKKALKEERVQANQKNYEILGDCWMQAEEVDKAVEAYEQSSKKNGDNGNIFVKLGRIYLSQNHWSQAVENMEKGLNLGEVDRIDEVYMQMGISYYNLKKYNEAIHSFQKAEELEGDYEISSRQWIRQAQNFL